MSNKALVRWTIGPCVPAGFSVLRKSIDMLRTILGEQVEYVVCHNQLQQHQVAVLRSFNVQLFDQSSSCSSLPVAPTGVAWKLYPPRLKLNAHELFVDNDLMLFAEPPELSQFLAEQSVLYTEGLFSAYGRYADLVPSSFCLNSGFFGLPPRFDFGGALLEIFEKSAAPNWADKFDEQGMVASILAKYPNQIKISRSSISICHDGELPVALHGHHFVSLNTGDLRAWWKYLGLKTVTLL